MAAPRGGGSQLDACMNAVMSDGTDPGCTNMACLSCLSNNGSEASCGPVCGGGGGRRADPSVGSPARADDSDPF